MPKNPFVHRGPVWDDHFFDREEEMNEVVEFLKRRPLQSISIVSPAQMGTTSFLMKLSNVVGSEHQPQIRFIYIDLVGLSEKVEFYECVANKLGGTAKRPAELSNIIEQITDHVFLVFDNFEALLSKPEEFNASFFGWLRNIAKDRIGLIIGSTRPLGTLIIPWDRDSSTFHQIFQTVRLSPWTKDIAKGFLKSQMEKAGLDIIKDDLDWICFEVNNLTPYDIKVLADHYFRERVANLINNNHQVDKQKIKKEYENEIRGKKKSEAVWAKIRKMKIAQTVIIIAGLLFFFYWLWFGFPKAITSLQCGNTTSAAQFFLTVEFPRYLAEGDVALLTYTVRSSMQVPPKAIVKILLPEVVQLDAQSKNIFQIDNLVQEEQRVIQTSIRRVSKGDIILQTTLQKDDGTTLTCTPTNGGGQAIISTGPIPYLNKLWSWLVLGSVAPSALGLTLLQKWLEKKVTK